VIVCFASAAQDRDRTLPVEALDLLDDRVSIGASLFSSIIEPLSSGAMLNRFKNALYGTSSSTDDSSIGSVYTDYKEAVFGRRFRGALTRSSSFREDLLSEVSRNNREAENGNGGGNRGGGGAASGLHRGRSQLLRKPPSTIREGDHDQYSSSDSNNHTNQATTRLASISKINKLASQPCSFLRGG
jgi:hypothetical protein